MLGNQSETLQISDLECGAVYELFVKQPLNGWQSELITFRTLGQAPIAPRKLDILQLVNRTLYIQLNAWYLQNVQPTSSLPLIYRRTSSTGDQSGEEFGQLQQSQHHKEQPKTDGCPIHRFLTEYRTSNAGLWKILNVQQADSSNLQPIELNMLNEKVIYTVRVTAYTVGKPFTVAEYDVRLNEQGLADYDEFLVLDGEDSITPLNINSRAMILDHTMFSIICSTLILLALGCVLLLLLVQKRRGLLMRGSNALPDKNSIYRKVINNNGDTSASASLLQSTIAYNNRSVASSIRQQPINNSLLSSNAISSSNLISNADSTYAVQAATVQAIATQAVAAALNGNYSGSPKLNNYNNQCGGSKLINSINKLNANTNGQNAPPDLPLNPPPLELSSAKRSNQINVYNQFTLAGHRNNNNNNLSKLAATKQDDEITPYATFTMSEEDVLERDEQSLMNSGDQLPPHIQELHEMHRQLSKIKQQQQQQQIKLKNANEQPMISASVVDLFKFGQSNPQQFIKQQFDKFGISRSRTTVEGNSPTSKTALRKGSNNLIYGGDNGTMNTLEKKLLEEEESDLRMFSMKISNPDYMFRYCMDGNQMIGVNNAMLKDDQSSTNHSVLTPHRTLTPPASYLNTIDRGRQSNSYKPISQLNQLNQMNELNKFNKHNQQSPSSTCNESSDTCSALYEFSCIFNKTEFNEQVQSMQNKMMQNRTQLEKQCNQMNRPSRNMINNLMISNEQHDELSDEEITSGCNQATGEHSASSDTNSDVSSTTLNDDESKSSLVKIEDDLNDCDRFAAYKLANVTANKVRSANDDDSTATIDGQSNEFKFNNNLKLNKLCNQATNHHQTNPTDAGQIGEHSFKAIQRARNRKASYTDMQTMLITEQKSSRKEENVNYKQRTKVNEMTNKCSDEKASNQKNRLKQFKNFANQGNLECALD